MTGNDKNQQIKDKRNVLVHHHLRNHGLNLHGAHILSLPPERVPGPVLEIQPAKLIHHEDISWPEEHVPLPPHVSDDLPVTGAVVSVAMIVSDRVSSIYSSHKFSSLVIITQLRQPWLISHGFSSVFVDPDDAERKKKWKQNRNKSNSTNSVTKINNFAGICNICM